MLAAAVAAPRSLHDHAMFLISHLSFPSNIPLVNQKAIVEHPLCRLCRVEPDAYRGECPKHVVPFLSPGDALDSEPAFLEVVLFRDLPDGTCLSISRSNPFVGM